MSMQAMDELREMLCAELEEIVKKSKAHGGEMSVGDLETTHKLTATIASIDEISAMEESQGTSGGMSQRGGGWEARGDYSRNDGGMGQSRASYRGESYGRGSSYANRGQHYVRGHYSRSDGVQELRNQLDDMLQDDRLDDQQRTAIKRAIEAMDR